MITLHLPVLLCTLVPIVLIEAWWISRACRLPFRRIIRQITLSNLVTMLLGFPLLWAILAALAFGIMSFAHWQIDGLTRDIVSVTLLAAWLPPQTARIPWLVFTAATVLMIPAFFLSVWIEGKFFKHFFPATSPAEANKAVYRAHLLSYGLLFAIWAAAFQFDLVHHDYNRPRPPEREFAPGEV